MGRLPSRLASLFAELRRRHVFRVALAYGAVAWLLVQMADVVFPALALPAWAITLVVVLVIVGFPIALVLAWAYDITPGGVQRTRADAHDRSGERARAGPPRTRTPAARSIAALPFANRSRDSADDYFSDGLTEELINALTRIPGLHVAARTSSFAFKDSGLDVRSIGERLEVRHVLEGSVRTAGSRLRMSVALIDVESGYTLWSERFDRELDDVFRIQQEIADAVVGRILHDQPRMVASPPPREPPTGSVEAFQLYLRGRYFWNRRTEPDLRRAIAHFEQAIAADPDYALAHAGLADAWSILLDHGLASPAEALPNATRAAERALQLDPGLAEAHTSFALTRQFDWQWAEAEQAFREALDCNPGYAVAHHRYALFLAWMGRGAEALERIEEARRLDPVSLIIQSSIAWIHYYARRFEDAARQLATTFEMDPHYTNAHIAHALVLAATARPADAIGELEVALRDSGGSTPILALLGYAYGAAGREQEARDAMARLAARAGESYVSPYYRALPHLGLGERSDALDCLDHARQERSAQMVYIAADPIWDPVRTDARFTEVLRSMHFPPRVLR